MSTYITSGKPLEFDNAPDWLVNYMQYRLTILNNTREAVMTYFKGLREFCQWSRCFQQSGQNPKDEYSLRSVDILTLPIDTVLTLNRANIETYLFFLSNVLCNGVSTRNKKLVFIRTFYEYVIDHQSELGVKIEVNPAGRIKKPRAPKKQPIYLPEEDREKLIDHLNQKVEAGDDNAIRNRAIFLLYLTAGIRLNEATRMDMDDLNLKDGTIRVKGKGAKERTVYLTEPCAAALEDYIEQYRSRITCLQTPALFISLQKKDRIVGKTIEAAFDKCIWEAGLGGKSYSPHKLRHSCATALAQEGHSVMVIKELLGHEDIGTTQIYTHLNNQDVAYAVKNSSLRNLGKKATEP